MKGMPSNPVECRVCHEMKAAAKDKYCHRCRPSRRLKYIWTPEMDALVRAVYSEGYAVRERGRMTRQLAIRFQFPHYIVKFRAAKLGLTRDIRHRWTPEEIRFLEESAGEMSVRRIAKVLGHGVLKVQAAMERMKISRRITTGMALADVSGVMGVTQSLVMKWERQGWLPRDREGRFQEKALARFLHDHPEQYDLRRVDQEFFKALIFPGAGCFITRTRS